MLHTLRILFLTIILPFVFTVSIADSDTNSVEEKRVLKFTLDQEIMPSAWRKVKKALQKADEVKATHIVIRLNTYGGMLQIADSIRSALLNTKATVIIFIDKNAASAGALISIACDSIYMTEAATMGAATVVNQTGEAMPDKYQSYMRAMMRATAEANGRDPKIAEAMVDDRIQIPGIIDSGKTLTFTTSEAIKHGFCNGQSSSIEEVLTRTQLSKAEIFEYTPSALDRIIMLLSNPTLNGILLLIMIGGIYFELQSPGVGFPILASTVAAVLYFAPLYLEGLAANWEIALFVIGILLIGLEIFIIPGFGIAGVSGIVLAFGGILLSMVQNDVFDFSLTLPSNLYSATIRVLIALLVTLMLPLTFGKRVFSSSLFKKIALQATTSKETGYTSHSTIKGNLIGKKGTVVSTLKPYGKISIGDERYDASSDGEYIEKGTTVEVVTVSGYSLIVKKVTS